MRPSLLARGSALCLLALAAGCQDPIPPVPAPTPTPVATPTPDTSALTPPPNFFVQPGRIYTYRRTPAGQTVETVTAEIGAIEGESYGVTLTTERVREAAERTSARYSQTHGVFPLGLSPAGLIDRPIDGYPRQTVRVPAGSFEVRRVESGGATYDFSEAYGILVRSETPEALLELLGAEPARYRTLD